LRREKYDNYPETQTSSRIERSLTEHLPNPEKTEHPEQSVPARCFKHLHRLLNLLEIFGIV
jgi:hypothetical protein